MTEQQHSKLGRHDYDHNPLLHEKVQAIVPWLIMLLIGMIGYFWQDSQAALTERLAGYDEKLKSISDTGLANREDIVAVRTKQEVGRTEWELREVRVLGAIEKNTAAIERVVDIQNRTNSRLVVLEQAVKSNADRLAKLEISSQKPAINH